MIKKKKRIKSVSLNNGTAENKARIKTFKPLIEDTAFNGLNTLNTLRPAGLNPPSSSYFFFFTFFPGTGSSSAGFIIAV
jgi:hypothetical protein